MRNQNSDNRLDASDTVFFQRQLESIDKTVYLNKYPEYKARMLLPMQQGVDPDASVYTYRMFDQTGKARPIGNASDDLPRAGAKGAETQQRIQEIGASYEYTLKEIRQASKTGTPLDEMRAIGARRALEELTDEYLALGNTALDLKGLLKLSGTSTVTSGGFWGDLTSADPDKVAADLLATGAKGAEATDQVFSRFTIVLPLAMYNIAAQLRMSTQSDTTVLKYALATSPYIEGIVPWFRCEASQGAIDASHDMICAFPRSAEVVAALVPKEPEFLSPEQRNLSYVINGIMAVGGVVCRFPKAITYCSVPTS